VGRTGVLEYVLITPSNHRVHHAQNKIYIDRNYGGILCVWDRMFGSFQDELAEEPCIYGIRKPLKSYNPFWANVHVYWSTFLDSWHTAHWRDKIKVWFKGPAWRPADLLESGQPKPPPLEYFSKFDPPVPRGVRIYAFFQFFCTTLASTGMLIVAGHWDKTALLLAVGLIFLSFYLQSRWTEGRKPAAALEWLKLTLLAAALNFFPLLPSVKMILLVYLGISASALIYLSLSQTSTASAKVENKPRKEV